MKQRATFGNLSIVLFLLMQAADGVLSYVGIKFYGVEVEGNPLAAQLMAYAGHGLGLVMMKIGASVAGIGLHLFEIDKPVFFLAVFYFLVAVSPWAFLLYLY
jgi:hypothetical protein